MSGLKRYGPLAAALGTGLVLILRAFGLGELADLVDQSGGDIVAALMLLVGVVMKAASIIQERRAREDTVSPRR